MHKFIFVVGAGLGFVLGSKVGTGPYEQLESTVLGLVRHPEVQGRIDQIRTTTRDQMSAAAQKAGARIPGQSGQSDDTAVTAPVSDLASNV